jgi:hypothetical protein
MGRRRIRVADVKEILVQWDAGASISVNRIGTGHFRRRVAVRLQSSAVAVVGYTRPHGRNRLPTSHLSSVNSRAVAQSSLRAYARR